MGLFIYFHIIYLLFWLEYEHANPIQGGEHEDQLNRPDVDYYEGYEEDAFSYNHHNNANEHVTVFNDLDLDSHQLPNENVLFEDNKKYDERRKSRILHVLSRGFHKMIRKQESDLDYEIEDRIVRYAMNNMREEI